MGGAAVQARMGRIAQKLRAAVRGKYQPFGAELHRFRRRRCLAEPQVAAFERRYAVALPPEYRAFLTAVANGGAGPGYGLYSLAQAVRKGRGRVPDDFLRTPFRHRRRYNPHEDPRLASFWSRVEEGDIDADKAERRCLYQAAGTLVLCDEGCGILHRLVVTGPSRGQVWVDDRCNEYGFFPLGVGFLDWYERWLDSTLAGGDGIWWHDRTEE